ncbi:MAG: MCE family protein [Lentisphaeria bacterium]|nr:MCE family protein [Lentisphaeria bacterium]
MIEVNKFKIGVFAVSGIVVMLGAVLLFGGSDIFKNEVKLVTLYDESVQGLEKGSQVKFRGVPIGKVTDIAILQSDSKIQIKMQIDPAAFIVSGSDSAELTVNSNAEQNRELKTFISQQIKKGLQVRMEYAGITGFKYIELNYFGAPADKLLPAPSGLGYDEIYIPAAPSMLSDAIQNISKSLENISKIRFDRISASLENSAVKINDFINDASLQKTVANLKSITDKLDSTLTEERLNIVLDDVQKISKDLQQITARINKESIVVKASDSIRNAGEALIDSSESLENTLLKLNSTLDKLTVLINLLNENPSALIRGKEVRKSNIK